MNVVTIKSEYSLDDGFVWVVFISDDVEYTLQACLRERAECKNQERRNELINNLEPLFKKAVNPDDTCMGWGVCGEVNYRAFLKFGEQECLNFFKKECKKIGVRFQ